MIKLSKASKMPCKSWSLQAIDTCPGSKDKNGGLVPACQGCYATNGNYRFPSVKAPRIHNKEDWRRPDWADEMVQAISSDNYFRWFDSGDCYSVLLAEKILLVMKATPNTQHWFPTRMHKFAKFKDVLARMENRPNVVVRKSSDSIKGKTVRGKTTSTIVPFPGAEKDGHSLCGAYKRDGKCGDCRACWDKSIKVIAYPAHGVSMLKLIAKG